MIHTGARIPSPTYRPPTDGPDTITTIAIRFTIATIRGENKNRLLREQQKQRSFWRFDLRGRKADDYSSCALISREICFYITGLPLPINFNQSLLSLMPYLNRALKLERDARRLGFFPTVPTARRPEKSAIFAIFLKLYSTLVVPILASPLRSRELNIMLAQIVV